MTRLAELHLQVQQRRHETLTHVFAAARAGADTRYIRHWLEWLDWADQAAVQLARQRGWHAEE